MDFINEPDKWENPVSKWWDKNLSYEALSEPAFDDEKAFDGYQAELEQLTAEGSFHGDKLRIVSMRASEVRKKVEELCKELWGHTLGEEGVCTNCGFVDDRTPYEAMEDQAELQISQELDK